MDSEIYNYLYFQYEIVNVFVLWLVIDGFLQIVSLNQKTSNSY